MSRINWEHHLHQRRRGVLTPGNQSMCRIISLGMQICLKTVRQSPCATLKLQILDNFGGILHVQTGPYCVLTHILTLTHPHRNSDCCACFSLALQQALSSISTGDTFRARPFLCSALHRLLRVTSRTLILGAKTSPLVDHNASDFKGRPTGFSFDVFLCLLPSRAYNG